MSELSTVKSEQRAVCRCCTLWLKVNILCPIFASPVPPKGRHHPLPTKPVSSRRPHRRQPGERQQPRGLTATIADAVERLTLKVTNTSLCQGFRSVSPPPTAFAISRSRTAVQGRGTRRGPPGANFIFHLTFDLIWILAAI